MCSALISTHAHSRVIVGGLPITGGLIICNNTDTFVGRCTFAYKAYLLDTPHNALDSAKRTSVNRDVEQSIINLLWADSGHRCIVQEGDQGQLIA